MRSLTVLALVLAPATFTSTAFSTSTVGEAPSFCDGSDGSLASCPCNNPGSLDTGCDVPIPAMAGGGLTGGIRLSLLLQETALQNKATVLGTGYSTGGQNGGAVLIRTPVLDPARPVVFGDGLRCVNGVGAVRLGATVNIGGVSTHTFGHGTMAGSGTFYYQNWFRSTPMSYCDPTAAFNLSNGVALTW